MKKTIQILTLLAMFLATGLASAQRTVAAANGVGKIPYFTSPSKGDMRFPVVIVQYKDVKISDTDQKVTQHFDDFFNQQGYSHNGATGSVRDYFLAASAGQFRPRFDILGVVTLANNRRYYGDGEGTAAGHPDEMVTEGVKAFQGKVDFSVYDSDGNGYVDDVIVVYAGNAERFGASNAAVLPTSYLISYNKYGVEGYTYGLEMDGLHFNSYTVTSELAYGKHDGLGTFLHEFSHALGLADEYNVYDTNSDYTPEDYDLMDIGMYNNNSRTPPTYSAFERFALGWTELEVAEGNCELQPLDVSNKAYIIPVTTNEFFVLENRQKQGWDKFLPGHGLMVWHIDYDRTAWYNNEANRQKDHQRIALIRPTDDITLQTWRDDVPQPIICDITEANGVVTFRVDGTDAITAPTLPHAPQRITDLSGRPVFAGDGTPLPSPGIYIVSGQGKNRKLIIR